MIRFELNFVRGVKSVSRFISAARGRPVVPAPLVEEAVSLLHFMAFAAVLKIHRLYLGRPLPGLSILLQ